MAENVLQYDGQRLVFVGDDHLRENSGLRQALEENNTNYDENIFEEFS